MNAKTRNTLLIIGSVLLIFAGIIGYISYRAYSFLSSVGISREIPDELKETKVLKGEDFLTRTEFYKLDEEGFLKTIEKSSRIEDEKERQKIIDSQTAKRFHNFTDIKVFGDEIIAAGEFGGFVFDLDGNLKRQLLFEPSVEKLKIAGYEKEHYQSNLDNLRIVALEKNKFGFSSFGSMQGFRVFDENGNQLWAYGKESVELSKIFQDEKESRKDYEKSTHVLEAAVGDLDGDGISEYIVARKSDGLRAFDRSGKELWFEKDDFPSNALTAIDTDGDGKNEILEVGTTSRIRDAGGKVLREIKGASSDDMVLFTEDKTKKKSFLFCDIYENKLTCVDEEKKSILTAAAPLGDIPKKNPKKILTVPGHDPSDPDIDVMDRSDNIYKPNAVWVNFRKDKPRYLAVIGAFIGIPRAILYVYDEKGDLVYQELLPENAETIAVLPATTGANDQLLIGGKNTIWKYSVK
jgi:hypothetical protein